MYNVNLFIDNVVIDCLYMELVPDRKDVTSSGAEQAVKIKDKINSAWFNGDEKEFKRGNRSVKVTDVEFDDDFIKFLDEHPMAFDMIRPYFYEEVAKDDPAEEMSWAAKRKTLF